MPTFLPSPLLLNSAEEPATGVIATRVTSWFDSDAGIVTPTMAAGIIRGGVVYDMTGYDPFVIPTTPAGVAVEIVIQLDEKRDGRQQLRDLPRRIVSVPDQATVTWDDLVDVVPVGADTQYSMPSWAAAILGVPAQVQGVVAAAQAAAAVAVAAKNAALAVGTTNAGVIASVLADPTSAPSIGLAEKYEPDDGGRPVGKGELKAFLRVQTPEMFGAKGDGATNDTAAMNAALAWAMRNKGVTVLLDAATYMVSSVYLDYSGDDWDAQPTNGEPYGFAAPSITGQGKRVSILKQIAGSTGARLASKQDPPTTTKSTASSSKASALLEPLAAATASACGLSFPRLSKTCGSTRPASPASRSTGSTLFPASPTSMRTTWCSVRSTWSRVHCGDSSTPPRQRSKVRSMMSRHWDAEHRGQAKRVASCSAQPTPP
jgi:hypothetical protein